MTFGAKSDSLRGREVTYFGIAPVEETVVRTDGLGQITSGLVTGGGFTPATISAFQNVTSQTDFKDSQIHSLEFNRVTWGWDILKSFAGIRYVHFADLYQQTNVNGFGETGFFELSAINNLIGPHIGGEIFYDVGYRLSYSLASEFGLYANFNEVDTVLTNNATTFIDADDPGGSISTTLELKFLAHYQLSQTARFRFGYNLLYLGEVATVSDNFNPLLTPLTATSNSDSDDAFFHGVSFGLEIFR